MINSVELFFEFTLAPLYKFRHAQHEYVALRYCGRLADYLVLKDVTT